MPSIRKKPFPRADPELAQHFYRLFGRSLLSQIVEMSSAAVMQSVRMALLAHEAGISVYALVSKGTHLCGPKRRILVKKR